jgi:hypothetical protein
MVHEASEGRRRLLLGLPAFALGMALSPRTTLAGPTDETVAPPALVDNVETLANLPGIIARGAGLIAGSPTASVRPGRVTVPTPSPARLRGSKIDLTRHGLAASLADKMPLK